MTKAFPISCVYTNIQKKKKLLELKQLKSRVARKGQIQAAEGNCWLAAHVLSLDVPKNYDEID